MCALIGYIATGRMDISVTPVPTPTLALALPPSTGNPGSWVSENTISQSTTFVAVVQLFLPSCWPLASTSALPFSALPARSLSLGLHHCRLHNPPLTARAVLARVRVPRTIVPCPRSGVVTKTSLNVSFAWGILAVESYIKGFAPQRRSSTFHPTRFSVNLCALQVSIKRASVH